jgi:hypothetical protein
MNWKNGSEQMEVKSKSPYKPAAHDVQLRTSQPVLAEAMSSAAARILQRGR